jgi:hypothetical protein
MENALRSRFLRRPTRFAGTSEAIYPETRGAYKTGCAKIAAMA